MVRGDPVVEEEEAVWLAEEGQNARGVVDLETLWETHWYRPHCLC